MSGWRRPQPVEKNGTVDLSSGNFETLFSFFINPDEFARFRVETTIRIPDSPLDEGVIETIFGAYRNGTANVIAISPFGGASDDTPGTVVAEVTTTNPNVVNYRVRATAGPIGTVLFRSYLTRLNV